MKLVRSFPSPSKLLKSIKSKSRSRSTTSFSSASDSEKPELSTPRSVLKPDLFSELEEAFKLIDSDDDGRIRREELEALLSRVGVELLELRLMVRDIDLDGDGFITLEEISALGSAFEPPPGDEEIREVFDFFDSDRDGKITAEELFRVFETIGGGVGECSLEDCRRMIRGVDRNGDGFVCFQDFSRMMDQQR